MATSKINPTQYRFEVVSKQYSTSESTFNFTIPYTPPSGYSIIAISVTYVANPNWVFAYATYSAGNIAVNGHNTYSGVTINGEYKVLVILKKN